MLVTLIVGAFLAIPNGTVNLVDDLVPAVRKLLAHGLTEDFQKACVRVGEFSPYSGGLKADLVSGLRIDIHAVLKVGGHELGRHVLLMNHVNMRRPKTFPSVLYQKKINSQRMFIITEQCRNYVTLLDKVYRETTTLTEFQNILDKVFVSLRTIHRIQPTANSPLCPLARSRDPFTARLHDKIQAILRADPELEVGMNTSGNLFGQPCPPFADLMERATGICRRISKAVPPTLVHGDPHLGNILVRRTGPIGYRVRLIDPNPEIGFSQPIYDIGKLLHWAEPVGWAKAEPSTCRSTWSRPSRSASWCLAARTNGTSAAAEKRRRWVESAVHNFAAHYQSIYGDDLQSALHIAVASAHLGLVSLFSKPNQQPLRRFVFAHALNHLRALPA